MKKLSLENYNDILEYFNLTSKPSYTKFCEGKPMDRHTLARYCNLFNKNAEEFVKYWSDFRTEEFVYHFEDKEKEFIKEYKEADKISMTVLASKYRYNIKKISEILKLVLKDEFKYKNKKQFNRHVFDEIDTEEKAYWLGFILADGYLHEERGTLHFSIGAKDYNHLVKFYEFIEGKEPVDEYIYPTTGGVGQLTYGMQLTDRNMADSLKRYGIFQAKSTKEQFNWSIRPDLLRHYIRGYFDGDGCITKNKNICSLVSSKELCYAVKKYCQDVIGIKFNPMYEYVKVKQGELYCFTLSSQFSALQFLDHIYKDSKVYLDRKYKLYLEKLELCPDFKILNGRG